MTEIQKDIGARVAATRADLEATLNEIEDKLDVRKRADEAIARVRSSYDDNPLPWIIGAVSAGAVIVGLIAWAVLSDD